MTSTRLDVAVFDGKGDFDIWKKKMKVLLSLHKVHWALEKELEKWPEAIQAKKAEVDEEAFNLLFMNLADRVIRKVDGADTALKLWVKLESLYSNKSAPNLAFIKGSLFSFKMDSSKSIDENLDEFLKINLLLKGTDQALDDTSLSMIILNSIPDTYQVVKDIFQYSTTMPTFDQVCNALKTREFELKNKKRVGNNLFVKTKNDQAASTKPGKNKKKAQSDKKEKETRKCFHCNKVGHLKKNCFALKNLSKAENPESNVASTSTGFTSEVLNVSDISCHDNWILDTGCSFHMCPNKDWFSDFKLVENESVFMGNNAICEVHGIGSIDLRLDNGNLVTLTAVRYIPDLKRNLISLGVLDDLGCKYEVFNGVMEVCRNGRLVLYGKKYCGLYVLCGCHVSASTHSVTAKTNSVTEKWHLRLGHMSQGGLNALSKQGLLGKDKIVDLSFCEPCVLAKQHRLSFKSGEHLSKNCLDYVHADLWGPEKFETHGGKKYFLSIVDDYSRRVWTFLLKTKDETFSKITEWKTLEENQTGRKLKALRTDNGLEFCNVDLDEFCRANGILRHRTVRKTPQQNGVAERMNRTLLEKVRSLLFTSGLPKSFWGEALNTAAYLINRSPNRSIDMKCPIELWSGRKPSLEHLRVFGCAAYAHNKEGKLDPRSLKCVFLGYQQQEGTKGYRLWEKGARGVKIIVSRDVIFDESSFPCKTTLSVESLSEDDPSNPEVSESDPISTPIDAPFEVEHVEPQEVPEPVELEPEQEDGQIVNDEPDDDRVENPEQSAQEVLSDYQLTRDRERRDIRPPSRYSYADLVFCALLCASEVRAEPNTYQEAIESKDKAKWIEAMEDEMNSLKVNNTWTLIEVPKGQKLIECRWLFKLKEGVSDSDPPRYKARLVAKGYTQREGIDFNEIFSPVVKFKTIRIMLSLVACFDLELEQLDVKTAFLHGELEERIVMRQPEGFVDKSKSGHGCLLKKSLYGLKQSPRQWYKRFDSFVLSIGFVRSDFDSCFYFSSLDNLPVYILLYVDDMLLISKSVDKICKLKADLSSEFDMKDLGNAKRILGMYIERDRKNCFLKIHQKPYLQKIVAKFGNLNSKPVQVPLAGHFVLSKNQCPKSRSDIIKMENVPYSNAIGSIMYAMISTRPDLSFAISLLSRYMSNPGYEHWAALKHVIAYINSSLDVGLCYSNRNVPFELVGYVDSDYAGDRDSRKSTTSHCFLLGQNCITWKSQLQPLVALSTTESEYIAICEAFKEAIWLQGLLKEARLIKSVACVFSDSQSAIHLSKNPVYHERTKHVDVRFHFIRDTIATDVIKLFKVATENNPADMGTKIVTVNKFKHCLDLLHIE